MAGKEVDRVRANSAVEVIRQHPALVLFAVSPALVPVVLIWWLAGTGWGILATIVLVLAGAAIVVVKR